MTLQEILERIEDILNQGVDTEYQDLDLLRHDLENKIIEGTRVWGFVSRVDGEHKGAPIKVGDIMKAAGWRAAAKHSRGSIFDAEMHKSFSWTGPNYL